jgi:hypothetical protein
MEGRLLSSQIALEKHGEREPVIRGIKRALRDPSWRFVKSPEHPLMAQCLVPNVGNAGRFRTLYTCQDDACGDSCKYKLKPTTVRRDVLSHLALPVEKRRRGQSKIGKGGAGGMTSSSSSHGGFIASESVAALEFTGDYRSALIPGDVLDFPPLPPTSSTIDSRQNDNEPTTASLVRNMVFAAYHSLSMDMDTLWTLHHLYVISFTTAILLPCHDHHVTYRPI